MKKKLLTSLGCLALAIVGALGLVGCGNKTVEHTVSFDDVTVNFVTGEEYDIKGVEWEKITEAGEDTHFADYKGAWQIKAGEEVGKLADALNGEDYHYVCVTFAGKGYDITKVDARVAIDTYPATAQDWGEDTNEDADPAETDYHLLISVKANTAKTVYLSLDWDGAGKEKAEIYKFVIPATGITLAAE